MIGNQGRGRATAARSGPDDSEVDDLDPLTAPARERRRRADDSSLDDPDTDPGTDEVGPEEPDPEKDAGPGSRVDELARDAERDIGPGGKVE